MQTNMKAAPARYRFKAGEHTPPPKGHAPQDILSKHNPPADDGESSAGDRPGIRGSAAVLISGMKNSGLSGNLMYTKGCIAFHAVFRHR